MFKIGIIGTENSHAMAFSKLINLPDSDTKQLHYDDARVVGVYGPDLDSPREIIDQAKAEFLAEKPEDFFGRVDAMMVTSRKGSVHYDYAMPFIEKGIPLFIDKPITADPASAKKLLEEAKKRGVPVLGGSGCKYAYDILMLKNIVKGLAGEGKFITAGINFPAELDSIYDGFYFYSSHLVEMALTVFGYDIKSVRASEKNGSVIVIARYDRYDVTLNFTYENYASSCTVYSKGRNIYREIDISMIYAQEVEKFVTMLRTGEMPISYDELYKPVSVIAAILEALKSGTETIVPEETV